MLKKNFVAIEELANGGVNVYGELIDTNTKSDFFI